MLLCEYFKEGADGFPLISAMKSNALFGYLKRLTGTNKEDGENKALKNWDKTTIFCDSDLLCRELGSEWPLEKAGGL